MLELYCHFPIPRNGNAFLLRVRATPYKLHQPSEPAVSFRDPAALPGVPPPDQLIARRIYLKPSDFERFGYTRGCKRCEHDKMYGPNRCKTNHSEACGSRIEAELAKFSEGQ